MALRCTVQLITTYLQRRPGNPADRLQTVLRPHFANVLNQLRRNTFHYPEQKVQNRTDPKLAVQHVTSHTHSSTNAEGTI